MATSIRSDAHRHDPAATAGGGWGAVGAVWRRPHRGWRRIERAPGSVAGLFVTIAMPLAAIGPLAMLFHDLRYGRGRMGIIQYRPTVAGAAAPALLGWLLSLALLAVLMLAIGGLSRRFGGTGDRLPAARAAVFGSSAFFAAGLFAALPAVSFLQLLGLYSVFLLAVGAPRLMKTPDASASSFGAAVAVLAVVLAAILFVVVGLIARQTLQPTVTSEGHRIVVAGAPAIPGSKLSAPATSKKGAAPPGTAAAAGVVSASSLQALLPTAIEGFTRTAVQSQSSVTGGVASATAEGTYVADTNSFTLTITDAGQPGALATTNSLVAGEVDKQTDTGWQRSHVVGGVRINEKWSNADHGGSFSRSVAGRFTVEARGTAPTIGTLRAAVAGVDATRLAARGH
jgi:uncharacterized membrane protein (DUF485 family)